MTVHGLLYGFAIVCFVIAAFPKLTEPAPVQFAWLAFACLVLTLIV